MTDVIKEVHIYGFKCTGQTTGIDNVGRHILDHLADGLVVKYIHAPLMNVSCKNGLAVFFRMFSIFLFHVLFYSIFNKTDQSVCVIAVNTKLPFWLSKRCMKIVIVHDLVFKVLPSSMNFLTYLADQCLIGSSLRRCNRILAVSRSTQSDIVKYYPCCANKISPLSLAPCKMVSKARSPISQRTTGGESYILSVGTIEPRKNYIRLLEAYAALPISIQDRFQLLIVGRQGWGRVDLDRYIKKLDLIGHVKLLGYTSDVELNVLYKNAYCVVMPSLYEGFGLPILEAHSFSVPVLTSSTSSMPEVGGKGAIYVDPYSVVSIRNGLISLMSDPVFRDNLAREAEINATRYGWVKTAKEITRLIEDFHVERVD